jgi:hypothetical protein
MMKVKPGRMTIGNRRFVVITEAEFSAIENALEDAGDLRRITRAKKSEDRSKRLSLAEVEAKYGLAKPAVRQTVSKRKKA